MLVFQPVGLIYFSSSLKVIAFVKTCYVNVLMVFALQEKKTSTNMP